MKDNILYAPVRRVMDSEVNKPFAVAVINSWDPDLAKYNGPIRRSCTANLDQVLVKIEMGERLVGQPSGPGPHPRLVLVPVVARFNDCGFDFRKNDGECVYGVLARRVRRIQANSV